MLASDLNNPQFAGASDPDSVIIARFHKVAVKNNFKSKLEGRPIWEDKIFCEYYPAGDVTLKMNVPAHESHKQRFSKQWAYYERTQGGDSREVGTPLSQWTILSPADVENLKGVKFNTVENIAAASDSQLQAIGMGAAGMSAHVLRARAQAYLGAAKDSALPQKQAEEIEQLKKDQAERDAKHAAEMAELRAMIEAKQTPPPKKKSAWTAEKRAAFGERMKKARESRQPKAE